MFSPDRPSPDIRDRILSATLGRVREERARRVRICTMGASVAIAAASLVWWSYAPPAKTVRLATSVSHAGTVPPDEGISIAIERLPARTRASSRIRRSSHQASIETLNASSSSRSEFPRIKKLTDEQLFASLPPGKSTVLLQNEDGTSRFLVFR